MSDLFPSRQKALHPRPPRPGDAGKIARRRDEIEVGLLRTQLAALEHDITAARATARRAEKATLDLSRRRRTTPRAGERMRLRDGGEVLVRPVERADAPLLVEGFAQLSAVSRFRRFLSPVDHLADEDVRFLTELDHVGHQAFAAIDAAAGGGVGVARYLRAEDEPWRADVAIAVLDAWQHRGVGTVLAECLAAAALRNGITHFTGRMTTGNLAAAQLLRRIGEPEEQLEGPGTERLTVRLHPSIRERPVASTAPV